MNFRTLLTLVVFFTITATASAQLRKTLHQSFQLPDSTRTLIIDFPQNDNWEIQLWAGNSIMTESDIKMYSANKGIFDFFLEKGRYDYITAEKGDSLALLGKDPERELIRAGDMECSEVVNVRIFIPDTFQEKAPGVWTRTIEERKGHGGKNVSRKKLDRERIEVSEELQRSVNAEEEVSDSLSQRVIKPKVLNDSTSLKKERNTTDGQGTGN